MRKFVSQGYEREPAQRALDGRGQEEREAKQGKRPAHERQRASGGALSIVRGVQI